MAVSSIGATCAQTKLTARVNIGDQLCTVSHLITAVEMMSSDLDDTAQQSAFLRVCETIKSHVRNIEASLDVIREGSAA